MCIRDRNKHPPGGIFTSVCAGITGAYPTPLPLAEKYRIYLENVLKRAAEEGEIHLGRSYFGPDLPGGTDEVVRIAVHAPSLIKGTTLIHDLVQRFLEELEKNREKIAGEEI